MKSFDSTHTSFSRAVKHNWQSIAVVSVLLLTLGSCLTLPAQAFNPKDLDAVLSGKNCVGCDLSGADLVGRDLSNIILRNSNLSKANLSYSSLKNADLSGTNLSEADLVAAFLFAANLRGANLHQAVLIISYLHQADLSRSDLSGVDLTGAYLFDAKFGGTNLSGANLEVTTLNGANLSEANLSNAVLKEALYDRSTLFPSGFDPKNAGLITSRTSRSKRQEPDRYDARLAELHQLSSASRVLVMGAYDGRSYGGCKDLSCFEPAIIVNERLLKLTQEVYGEQSSQVVAELSALASLYKERENYNRAESLYLQALAVLKKIGKPNDSIESIYITQELAGVYRLQDRYTEALPLLERVLAYQENAASSGDELTEGELVTALDDLATVYLRLGKYSQAETLYNRALTLEKRRKNVISDITLLGLALTHHAQGHGAEAEALYQQILKDWKERFADYKLPDPPFIASTKNNLMRLQRDLPPILDIK